MGSAVGSTVGSAVGSAVGSTVGSAVGSEAVARRWPATPSQVRCLDVAAPSVGSAVRPERSAVGGSVRLPSPAAARDDEDALDEDYVLDLS